MGIVPYFDKYTGQYPVSYTDIHYDVPETTFELSGTVARSVEARIVYPTEDAYAEHTSQWLPEPARKYTAGLAGLLGNGILSHLLASRVSPLNIVGRLVKMPMGADCPLRRHDKPWPVVVFSHGLCGNKSSYSYYTCSIASHGYIVIVPEHKDGSAPISREVVGEDLWVPFRSVREVDDDTRRFRVGQLEHRIFEISQLVSYLKHGNVPSITKSTADLGHIAYAGHSFGAATVMAMRKGIGNLIAIENRLRNNWDKRRSSASLGHRREIVSPLEPNSPEINATDLSPRLSYNEMPPLTPLVQPSLESVNDDSDSSLDDELESLPGPAMAPQVKTGRVVSWRDPVNMSAIIALDPWMFPVSEALTVEMDVSVLCIISEQFEVWETNFTDVKECMAANSNDTFLYKYVQSAHHSQSDFGVLFPNIMRAMYKTGNKRPEEQKILEANILSSAEFLDSYVQGIPPAKDGFLMASREPHWIQIYRH
ncbi:hypothetical protein CANCADRAFT_32606 [Tortispora caseinolytica NRRL Y-17796]|uniref:1-alkyl-2-acetylglycerophosphocholine esterase n=1 Tax=Tortispora caseinolytica NRRL Y-17796 TaxID=767744 RepID=A0A1E4TC49_9ASCO|nr:hypothetical protein CANCADRAFT_32606 [Tortispora caseinolytica NRRL Y-17796]